jgi:hypothetical protein
MDVMKKHAETLLKSITMLNKHGYIKKLSEEVHREDIILVEVMKYVKFARNASIY